MTVRKKWIKADGLRSDTRRVVMQFGKLDIDGLERIALYVLMPETVSFEKLQDLTEKMMDLCEDELNIKDISRH